MTSLCVSMAFHLGRSTLWLIIVRLIMIDDGHPRTNTARKQRGRHYHENINIGVIELSRRYSV